LVQYAKANPGKLNYGSTGIMGLPHLAGALFAKNAGIDMVHVPYRGGGPVVNDLLSGQVDLYFGNPLEVAQHFRPGGLKPLAVTSKDRMALMPEIPSLHESGLPNFDLKTWTGIFCPVSTPSIIVEKLNSEINIILSMEETKQRLKEQFTTPVGGSSGSFAEFLDRQHTLFAELVKTL
jgi:tripartite-type tricarboxylate transporter receptor subunit TctC